MKVTKVDESDRLPPPPVTRSNSLGRGKCARLLKHAELKESLSFLYRWKLSADGIPKQKNKLVGLVGNWLVRLLGPIKKLLQTISFRD